MVENKCLFECFDAFDYKNTTSDRFIEILD